MKSKEIIDQIKTTFLIQEPQLLSNMPIHCTQLLFEEPATLTPHILYIQAESFPLNPDLFPDCFFLLKETVQSGKNAISCFTGTPLELYHAVSSLLVDDKIYAQASFALQQASARSGIEGLLHTAYQYLQNPIHVLDRVFSLTAVYPETPCGNMAFDHFLIHKEPQKDYLRHVEKQIMKFSDHHIHCAQLIDFNKEKLKLITCSIGARPNLLGGIEILQHNRSFTQTDVKIVDELVLLLQIEMIKSNRFHQKPETRFEQFMLDILYSHKHHQKILESRLTPFTHLLNQRFYLLFSLVPESKVCTLKYYLEEIMHWTDRQEYFKTDEGLYFLVDEAAFETKNTKSLETLAKKTGTQMIFSHSIDSLLDSPSCISLLPKALATVKSPAGLFWLKDLYFKTLLESMSSQNIELKEFIHPGVHRLKKFDHEHETDFLETFKTYLQYQCSPSQTADALHLHRNSLAYRIQKARAISCFFSEDARDCQNFLLSIQIDEYLND